jgi:hypothetical protein
MKKQALRAMASPLVARSNGTSPNYRRFKTMKKALIGALASLMLAGALAGVTESTFSVGASTVLILGDSPFPVPVDSPLQIAHLDSMSR